MTRPAFRSDQQDEQDTRTLSRTKVAVGTRRRNGVNYRRRRTAGTQGRHMRVIMEGGGGRTGQEETGGREEHGQRGQNITAGGGVLEDKQ